MRWLSDDRGATVVLTAIVLAVILAMAGLVVDVGALYQERRELSNGADAAVLAIAENCGLGRSCSQASAEATAHSLAAANADDHAAGVDDVALDVTGRQVSVLTSTLTTGGGDVLEPFFGQVVGFDGSTVRARATAIWGFPRALRSSIPLIISECEFPGGTALPTPHRVLYFHDGNNAEPCNAQAGHDTDGDGVLAGGFGWLVGTSGCKIDLSIGQWVSDDPGASPTSGCSPDQLFSLLGEEIPLPFFNDIDGVGSNGRYLVAGFGLFHVTGFNFGGQYKAPDAASAPCGGDERCISGYFTSGVIYDGEPGGPDHGLVLVKLTE